MKSTTANTFTLGFRIFPWASKKTRSEAQAIVETEYIAANMTTSQALWLQRSIDGTKTDFL